MRRLLAALGFAGAFAIGCSWTATAKVGWHLWPEPLLSLTAFAYKQRVEATSTCTVGESWTPPVLDPVDDDVCVPVAVRDVSPGETLGPATVSGRWLQSSYASGPLAWDFAGRVVVSPILARELVRDDRLEPR